ncbi:hypothetical protein CCACVL1_15450 [Corchorus capsularis]|uniref:Uncharacterized protein n=1 Tax=Corchorus capsularis TaxID=210143 RepID=A0A1R3I2B3_COCAP|nr:hypothetical protein CCACVL1_15450 [Corchorus capsularis]
MDKETELRSHLHEPNELGDCMRVLDRFLELGVIRSRPDVVIIMEGGDGAKESRPAPDEKVLIEEKENGLEGIDLGMAIMVRSEEKVRNIIT